MREGELNAVKKKNHFHTLGSYTINIEGKHIIIIQMSNLLCIDQMGFSPFVIQILILK